MLSVEWDLDVCTTILRYSFSRRGLTRVQDSDIQLMYFMTMQGSQCAQPA